MTKCWNHRLGAILFALLTASTSLCAREPRQNEGELATELFGIVAEESGCETYAVAWLDRAKEQVEARCAATSMSARELAFSLPSTTRFVVDVSVARAEYQRHVGVRLPRSATVLAHLLTVNRNRRGPKEVGAPLLLYLRAANANSNIEAAKSQTFSHGKDAAFFVFSE